MVPSELTRGITMGELLIFLGCWKQGPYIVPDQQEVSLYQYTFVFAIVKIHPSEMAVLLKEFLRT